MQIFLGFESDKRVMQLPINPPSLEVSESTNSETFDIIELGKINILKGMELSEINFSSFFPSAPLPTMSSEILNEPMWYVTTLKKWMASKKPIHLVVASDSVKIDWDVSIESFDWSERGGAVGDIDYSLSLKKYKYYGAKKVTVAADKTQAVKQPSPRPDNRPKAKTYTIKKGDSLWIIAKNQLGNANRWREIQKLNNIPDSKLRKLQIGMVIKLP